MRKRSLLPRLARRSARFSCQRCALQAACSTPSSRLLLPALAAGDALAWDLRGRQQRPWCWSQPAAVPGPDQLLSSAVPPCRDYPLDLRPLWLHARSYSCVEGSWSFATPLPEWARLEWQPPRSPGRAPGLQGP